MLFKKIVLITLAVFAFSFLFQNCKSQNSSTSKSKKEIIFGSGGGFTGKVTEYHLKSDRTLYRVTTLPRDTTHLATLSKKSYKQINEKLKAASLDSFQLDEPGNTYHFITIKDSTNATSVTWGNPDITVPEKVNSIYSELMSLVKNQSSK